MKKFTLALLALFALALFPVTLFAQDPDFSPPDEAIRNTIAGLNYWKFLLVPASLVIVMAVKWLFGRIPDKLLPWIAPFIGAFLDLAASKAGFWTGDAGIGATMGGLATWFHQAVLKQPKKEDTIATPAEPSNTRTGTTVGLILALTLPLFALGCKTTGDTAPKPETIATYLADARDIAELATVAALIENPSYRHELTTTRDSLNIVAELSNGSVSTEDLVNILSQLPIENLSSEKGRIYITGGRIIVRRFVAWMNDPQIDIGGSGYIQQFAKALSDGITAGLGTSGARVEPDSNPAPYYRLPWRMEDYASTDILLHNAGPADLTGARSIAPLARQN